MKPILKKVDLGYDCSFSVREDVYPFLYNYWHYHPEVELTLIRKGKGVRFVGDNLEQFKDNDLILLGANLPHYWRSDAVYFNKNPNIHVEAIAIHFKEDFWGRDFLEIPELDAVKNLLQESKRGIAITGKTKKLIIPMMEAMLKAEKAKRVILLLEVLQQIASTKEIRLLSSTGFSKSYNASNPDRINEIYDYTFKNFHRKITIREISAAINISPHSFCRYFKTHTFKTYWQFLLEVRIGYACKLLIEDKLSVTGICYECGFNNLSNFSRQFRNVVGMTPLQYSKTHLIYKNSTLPVY